jgi:hypothetical protein
MRVSRAFNSIAAPLLYRTVILPPGKMRPYGTVRGRRLTARLSATKAANLELIKHVFVNQHPSNMKGFANKKYAVDTLRLPISLLQYARECCKCVNLFNPRPTCQCIFTRMYRPQKLVVMDARMNSSVIDISGFETLQTLVFVIASSCSPHTPSQQISATILAGIERIVQIFWTSDPSTACGVQLANQEGQDEDFEWFEPIDRYTSRFASGLRISIRNYPQLKEIIVVNGGQLHPYVLDLKARSSRREREVKFEDKIFRSLTKLATDKATHRPGHISFTYKYRVIEIKFVSMWEYLEYYDWSGEFTEDEIRPWLDDTCERD